MKFMITFDEDEEALLGTVAIKLGITKEEVVRRGVALFARAAEEHEKKHKKA